MGKIMILNASPRAPRSNSKQYAEIFSKGCGWETEFYNVTSANHLELCRAMENYSDILLVFPLYADGIPVTLLNFLKTLEDNGTQHRPVFSVIINCGFLEPNQNDVAVRMVELFCKQNGYPFGSVLKIGSGEAILTTPLRALVERKMQKLSDSILARRYRSFQVTMPMPKRLFIRASTRYWEEYGKRNGIDREEMAKMQIEE